MSKCVDESMSGCVDAFTHLQTVSVKVGEIFKLNN